MKFKKDDKKMLVVFSITTLALIVSYFVSMWLLQDSVFDNHRDLIQGVMNFGYCIAGFMAFIVGSFFFYLKFCVDEKGNVISKEG